MPSGTGHAPGTASRLRLFGAMVRGGTVRRPGDPGAGRASSPSEFLSAPDPAAATLDYMSTAAPKWILVADDNDGLREVWTHALSRVGYRVLEARNGREALELMRAVVPDLVLLDLRMPEMDGPAFLKVLDGSPVFGRIPVLIVSGYLEEAGGPPTSLGLNVVGGLSKPLRLADLLGAVQAALVAEATRPA